MITIEEMKTILEVTSETTSLLIFTIIGTWAIIKFVKMNEIVKEAIVKEKEANVQRLLPTGNINEDNNNK